MKNNNPGLYENAVYRVNPYAEYARIRAQTPLFPTTMPDGTPVLLVTRYADVVLALKDSRLVKNINNARATNRWSRLMQSLFSGSNMLRADPPDHTRLRKLASEAFKPKYIAQMRDSITTTANQLIDRVVARGQMDLIRDFALPLPITVITQMLGVPTSDHAKFHVWSNAIIASGTLSSESPVVGRQVLPLVLYMRKLIAQRRKNPGDDLVSQLITASYDDNKLSDPELISTTILLLIAGHETTVNLIGNGMLALMQHPAQYKWLHQTPGHLPAAIEEMLRFANPVHLVNRYASVDMEIAGVPIARGTHLQLILAAANHDDHWLPDAATFDITRDEAKHMAFSQGIHYCLGAPLARLEGEIAVATLLDRLPQLQMDTTIVDLTWRSTIELRGLKELPVKW